MTLRILHIDDNSQHRQLVSKILQSNNFEVVEASDGAMGINLAQKDTPDLILIDMDLPEIDGLETVNEMRAISGLQSIPIVALTANANYGDEDRARSAGCDGYIVKPVSRVQLTEQVKQYLNIAE